MQRLGILCCVFVWWIVFWYTWAVFSVVWNNVWCRCQWFMQDEICAFRSFTGRWRHATFGMTLEIPRLISVTQDVKEEHMLMAMLYRSCTAFGWKTVWFSFCTIEFGFSAHALLCNLWSPLVFIATNLLMLNGPFRISWINYLALRLSFAEEAKAKDNSTVRVRQVHAAVHMVLW